MEYKQPKMATPTLDKYIEKMDGGRIRLRREFADQISGQREKYAELGSIVGLVSCGFLGGMAGGIRPGLESVLVMGVMGIITGYYVGRSIGYSRGNAKIKEEAKTKYPEVERLIIQHIDDLDKRV